mgnify:CR=1 FL=1
MVAVPAPDGELTAETVVLRFIANTREVYPGEKVQAGAVMRWIDEAANVCATRWSGLPVVAVFAGGVRFYQPVRVGDLVEIEARLVHTSARSMHVSIRARAGDRRERSRLRQVRGDLGEGRLPRAANTGLAALGLEDEENLLDGGHRGPGAGRDPGPIPVDQAEDGEDVDLTTPADWPTVLKLVGVILLGRRARNRRQQGGAAPRRRPERDP